MGHLFRALNIIEMLNSKNCKCIVLINDDKKSILILKKKGIIFKKVNLDDLASGWEGVLINKYKIDIWINDRLDTRIEHSRNVNKSGVKLVSFDDRGNGAKMADINFGSLPFNFDYTLSGKKVLKGQKYLILNKDVDRFKRERERTKHVLITFGGSDTHGVTIKVLKILKKLGVGATIMIGPCFKHLKELKNILDEKYEVINSVPSIIREFYRFDLAITGGGITPIEANATGLPCIIVASEIHEVDNGLFLKKLGSSVFAGHHKNIIVDVFTEKLDIKKMSKAGLSNIKIDGLENIYREISSL
jgi:spore coat polysaccharide biosynthesis predicted glycosyltransferase SpsG